MAINITFYNNASSEKTVHKSKTEICTRSCEIWGMEAIEEPVLKVQMVPEDATHDPLSCNYVYIPRFKRYYFADISIYDGNNYLVRCKSDGLSSFWDSYKNSPCIASRSSNNFDNELDDSEVLQTSVKTYEHRKLNGKFTPTDATYNYVVTVAGGGTSQG